MLWLLFNALIYASRHKAALAQCHHTETSTAPRKWLIGEGADRSGDGYYFVGTRYRSARCFSLEQCSFFCLRDERCKSFNYLGDSETCELNSDDRSALLGGRSTYVLFEGRWLQQEDGLIQKEHSVYCNRNCFENALSEEFVPTVCDPSCSRGEVCAAKIPGDEGFCMKTKYIARDFLLPWGDWSTWSACSVTCGAGVRTRTRTCGPARADWMCKGPDTDRAQCQSNTICPQWAWWGSWSSCSTAGTCGDGTRSRHRVCSPDSYDPSACPGHSNETEKCRPVACHAPILLTDGLSGYVMVNEDDDPTLPKWRAICKDRISDSDLPQVLSTTCRQLGLHYDQPSHLTSLPDNFKVRVRILNCNNRPKYLMECDHTNWTFIGDCEEHLQVQCVQEKSFQHHYIAQLSWQVALDYCAARFRQMCSFSQVFPYGNSTAIWGAYGDNWVPIRETTNEWVQVGFDDNRLGRIHSVFHGFPAWGTSTAPAHWKGHILCCMLE